MTICFLGGCEYSWNLGIFCNVRSQQIMLQVVPVVVAEVATLKLHLKKCCWCGVAKADVVDIVTNQCYLLYTNVLY